MIFFVCTIQHTLPIVTPEMKNSSINPIEGINPKTYHTMMYGYYYGDSMITTYIYIVFKYINSMQLNNLFPVYFYHAKEI